MEEPSRSATEEDPPPHPQTDNLKNYTKDFTHKDF